MQSSPPPHGHPIRPSAGNTPSPAPTQSPGELLRSRKAQTMPPKETKKDQLIDVASKLFFEQGYRATGVQQIIDAAGIAKGTFYSHFRSKDELGLAWLQTKHAEWVRHREAFVAQAADTPAGRIVALLDLLDSWMQECDFRGCAFLNTLAETPDFTCPMRCEILAHKRGMLDFLRSLVDQHLPHAAEDENAQRAGAIYLLLEAAMIEAQNFRCSWPIKIARKQTEIILASR